MKKIWFIPALALAVACSNNPQQDHTDHDGHDHGEEVEMVEEIVMAQFGADLTEDGAQALADVIPTMEGKDSLAVKLTGTVEKVCQVKGCWMTMAYGEGESMRVSFKDYGFFVPKDISGKDVVMEGWMYMETTSVEDLKHYAEDEGLSAEEIAEITEPETAYTFVANGVIVKDYAPSQEMKAEEGEAHDHEHGEDGHDHDHAG